MTKTIFTLMGYYKSQNRIITPDDREVLVIPFKHLNFQEMINQNCFFHIEDDGRYKRILNIIPIEV
jgi:hypothetical protein